jgi:hypothetical protein
MLLSWNRSCNPTNQAAANLSLRQHGYWDWRGQAYGKTFRGKGIKEGSVLDRKINWPTTATNGLEKSMAENAESE